MVYFPSPWDDEEPTRRAPPKALKRLVWDRDRGICQICNKKADPFDWELGHNRAVARGGKLTVKNTFVVHSFCNRSMATKTKAELARALGVTTPAAQAREALARLSMAQLKVLAKKHGIRVKGSTTEGSFFWSETERKPPTKKQYVNALAKVLTPQAVKREVARLR